ncbi:hypothetical protein LR48_Vigan10g024800 [Vigna angularis]|uniref:Uncharacterized protein n=1 Tax=Phaseolus angularis TaxID=3914 RepID=A0A0L9VH30_PHAAN|nr:hypothetical protein LR48_Vigan10g024800 [Vigna angularis]
MIYDTIKFDRRGVESTESFREQRFDTVINRTRDRRTRPTVAEKRGLRGEVIAGSRRDLTEGWRGEVTVVDEGLMKRAGQRRGFDNEESSRVLGFDKEGKKNQNESDTTSN